MPMATKLGRVVTYGGWTHGLIQVTFLSRGHLTNEKPYNCIFATPISSKLGRVVT